MLPASKETEWAAARIQLLLSFPAFGKFFPTCLFIFNSA